jgi:hypothetical protein
MSEYMNVAEAAEYTGLATSTLNKRRLTGDGPDYFKLGRRVGTPGTASKLGCDRSGGRPHRTLTRRRRSKVGKALSRYGNPVRLPRECLRGAIPDEATDQRAQFSRSSVSRLRDERAGNWPMAAVAVTGALRAVFHPALHFHEE